MGGWFTDELIRNSINPQALTLNVELGVIADGGVQKLVPAENCFALVSLAVIRKRWVFAPNYDTWLTQITQADEEGILIC